MSCLKFYYMLCSSIMSTRFTKPYAEITYYLREFTFVSKFTTTRCTANELISRVAVVIVYAIVRCKVWPYTHQLIAFIITYVERWAALTTCTAADTKVARYASLKFTCNYLYLVSLVNIQINGNFFQGCKFVNLLHGIHVYLDIYSPLA